VAHFAKADKAFGEQHGCLPMETKLPYKWPFALDILKRQYDALPSQRLLAFQSQYFDKMGPNMLLMLFGQVGYMTTDPKNIESILSTHFEGLLWPNLNWLYSLVEAYPCCRLGPWVSPWRSLSFTWRRYLYTRWTTMETLPRTSPPPVCANPISEPEGIR
jgi:hypothetical protein